MSRWTRRGTRALAMAAILAVVVAMVNRPGPPTRLRTVGRTVVPVVLNDNGGWSWFEDERAVVDRQNGALLVSSVASASGTGGSARDGNVEIVAYDLSAGTAVRTVLHSGLEADDHDSAALYVRPDGRYVAMYSRHTTDRLSRWRVTRHPGNPTDWGPESTLEHRAVITYSNVHSGSDGHETVLYGFVRSVGRDPHLLVSHDLGSTWTLGGRLFDAPGRPYVRYAADGSGRIHLITTEQHPDNFGNGIYHGVVADGQLLRSDGTVVDTDLADEHAARPEQLTAVFPAHPSRQAWTVDLQVDPTGRPYAAFSVHNSSGQRYYYARYDGARWHVHPMAHAGSALYPAEANYTGLVALDPHDPGRVFVSTDVHPDTGVRLISTRDQQQHHELFEGVTIDGGFTWTWTAVTADSTVDNIRPVVPIWDAGQTALLWLRGTYTSYHDYDLDVVAILVDRSTRPELQRANCDASDGSTSPPPIPLFPAAQPGCRVSARRRRRSTTDRRSVSSVAASARISRRRLVVGLGATGAIALTSAGYGVGIGHSPLGARPRPLDPFTLGVASGESRPDGVVLWSRLAPDPLVGGGMPDRPVSVAFQVAVDEAFRKVVARGSVPARPELGHSVHAEVSGLRPGSWYWYRFRANGYVSPTGRTRTAPAFGRTTERVAFALTSCQRYSHGYYTAHRHMANEDLDVVVQVGDYVYQSAPEPTDVRPHEGTGEPVTLAQYRNRHAQYRTDEDLRACHAAFPWLVVLDDHEVDNNWADELPQDPQLQSRSTFLARRSAAFQAYYEHMPLRRTSLPRGVEMELYRRATFGDLLDVHLLDTRQYRSDQDQRRRLDPRRSILGRAQERWLLESLAGPTARWNALAQQVFFSQQDLDTGPGRAFNDDSWDNYVAERDWLRDHLVRMGVSNPVILTGDVHANYVCDVKADFADPASPTVATELVGTSISSDGNGADNDPDDGNLLGDNPHIKFVNRQRGYVRNVVTPAEWIADFRVLDYVTEPGSPITTRARFVIEAGRPGSVRA